MLIVKGNRKVVTKDINEAQAGVNKVEY